MGHFFSKVSLFIDKKEAAAHLILDQDFATAPTIQHGIHQKLSSVLKIELLRKIPRQKPVPFFPVVGLDANSKLDTLR